MSPAEARLKEVSSDMTEAEWTAARQSRRLLPPGRAVWLGRSGRHPHLRARAGAGASLPDQPLRPDVRRDHGVEPGQGRSATATSSPRATTASTRPASPSIRRSTRCARMPAACSICTRPTAPRSRADRKGLLPLNQTAQLVTHDLAYHDYEGIALDHDERPRLQKDLGNKNHMLLRNHGTLTVGRSVASAFERMYHLERACTMQVRTRMLGPTAYPVEQAVIDKNTALFSNPDRRNCARRRWSGRRCCASSTASTPATGIEFLRFWCSIRFQRPLHYRIKTPPNPGRRFCFVRCVGRARETHPARSTWPPPRTRARIRAQERMPL